MSLAFIADGIAFGRMQRHREERASARRLCRDAVASMLSCSFRRNDFFGIGLRIAACPIRMSDEMRVALWRCSAA